MPLARLDGLAAFCIDNHTPVLVDLLSITGLRLITTKCSNRSMTTHSLVTVMGIKPNFVYGPTLLPNVTTSERC